MLGGSPIACSIPSLDEFSGGRDGTHEASTIEDSGLERAPSGEGSTLDAANSIVRFVLIDTSKVSMDGVPVAGFDPLVSGATIDVGSPRGIKAVTVPSIVGSVEFLVDGASHIESNYTYAACGNDSNGNWSDCAFAKGTHTVSARAFAGPNKTGEPGPASTVTFTVP